MKTITVNGRKVVIHPDGNVSIDCNSLEEYKTIAKYLVREGIVNLDDHVSYPRPLGADF